ncbi:MAG: Holliday junction branch migration protein RuvA [Synergistaceae bacterium]
MIDSLRGTVISIYDSSIVIDINGIGIKVYATSSLLTKATVGEELFCYTFMQVSEVGIYMFAFSTEIERDVFLELLQVKTVGGKLAINLLTHLSVEQILRAIISENTSALSVPGLGAKRAERICFELKNKILKKFPDITSNAEFSADQNFDRFVLDALRSLGFSSGESLKAIYISKKNASKIESEEDLLKLSLSYLQKI